MLVNLLAKVATIIFHLKKCTLRSGRYLLWSRHGWKPGERAGARAETLDPIEQLRAEGATYDDHDAHSRAVLGKGRGSRDPWQGSRINVYLECGFVACNVSSGLCTLSFTMCHLNSEHCRNASNATSPRPIPSVVVVSTPLVLLDRSISSALVPTCFSFASSFCANASCFLDASVMSLVAAPVQPKAPLFCTPLAQTWSVGATSPLLVAMCEPQRRNAFHTCDTQDTVQPKLHG